MKVIYIGDHWSQGAVYFGNLEILILKFKNSETNTWM
jgi:hypothetical protein